MKFINNGNSFLLSAPASIFAAEIKNELKRHTMFNGEKKQIIQSKRLADALFILWAGGAALLSYSLVYALRKPFTAAGFDGLDFFGMDYKTATSIVQISAITLLPLPPGPVTSRNNCQSYRFASTINSEANSKISSAKTKMAQLRYRMPAANMLVSVSACVFHSAS